MESIPSSNTTSDSTKKYWCFTCQKEAPVNIDKDGNPLCKICGNDFIEEILPSETSDRPQNFIPAFPSQPLIFLPSTVNCIPVSEAIHNPNQLISSFTTSLAELFGGGGASIIPGPLPIVSFLSNHNNDMQFETLLNLIMRYAQNFESHPPASENAIKNLKKLKVDESNIKTLSKLECTVCLNDFVLGDELYQLDCGHEFHQSCILKWLKIHNTCPICRSELESNNPEYEMRKNTYRENLRNLGNNNNNQPGQGSASV